MWFSDAIGLMGSSWSVDLGCFTPLDDAARQILEYVSARRARNSLSQSPWPRVEGYESWMTIEQHEYREKGLCVVCGRALPDRYHVGPGSHGFRP